MLDSEYPSLKVIMALSALLSECESPSTTLLSIHPTKYVDISCARSIYKVHCSPFTFLSQTFEVLFSVLLRNSIFLFHGGWGVGRVRTPVPPPRPLDPPMSMFVCVRVCVQMSLPHDSMDWSAIVTLPGHTVKPVLSGHSKRI